MADVRIQQYPLKSIVSDNDIFLIADSNDVDVNGFLKYKKVRAKDLPSIVNTAESITYANLMASIAADDLIIGTFYKITDSTSGVSPLLVQAIGVDAIGYLAFDASNPLVTINYDVMTDTIRWSLNQTVAPISLGSLSATTPLSYNNTTGVFTISQSNTTTNGYLSSADWNTFTAKQNAGNYITALTGEATASGPGGGGSAAITLDNTAVIGKVLSGLNVTGGNVVSTDSILTAFGKTQNQINALVGGVMFQGVWDAATNNPALTSSVGTKGYYYVVNVAGSTNLNGITDWKVGDWAIFDGSAWQKVDNTDSVSSVNGQTGAVSLTASDVGAAPTTRTITAGTGLTGGGDLTANRTFAIDSTVATLTGTQTLTNKTITSPVINEILDSNGNEILGFTPIASATDYITIKNGIGVGVPLHISAAGSSANTGLHLEPKGTGLVQISDGTDTTKGFRFRSSASATGAVTLIDAVSSAGRVITLPNATTTLVGTNTTDTLTNKSIAGDTNTLSNIGNASLTNSAITINGTSTSLGGSINVGTVTSVAALTLGTSGTDLTSTVATGTTTPVITLNVPTASASNRGALSSTDWSTFNGKQNAITLTTTGTSGAATLVGSTLNIPNYADTDTGITSLNGLTALTQTFAVGTSGTDFGISSATSTHTFNLPTASAANRGALSSADWTTFNNKASTAALANYLPLAGGTLTGALNGTSAIFSGQLHIPNNSTGTQGGLFFDYNANAASRTWQIVSDYDAFGDFQIKQSTTQTGTTFATILGFSPSGAATFSSSVTASSLIKSGGTSSQYLMADGSTSTLTNPVTGTGTTNYLPKFTGTSALGNSNIQDSGSLVSIGVSTLINTGTANQNTKIFGDKVGISRTSDAAEVVYLSKTAELGIFQGTANIFGYDGIQFRTEGSETVKATITAAGNVGLGTTSPATKFHIQDTNGGIFFDGSGATYNRFKSTTSSASTGRDLLFSAQSAGTTPDLYITSAGNVGIGTSSPSNKLDVNGSVRFTNGTNPYLALYDGTSTSYLQVSGGNLDVRVGGANAITFNTNSAERMRITSSGNLLIGTTTDAGYKLDVNGTARVSGATSINGVGLSSSVGASALNIKETATSPSALSLNNRNATQVWTFAIDTAVVDDGNFGLYNGVTSLQALKITPAGAATFTGQVNIGNPVAAAVAVASTHKVTIVIGGVTYYLLASNV